MASRRLFDGAQQEIGALPIVAAASASNSLTVELLQGTTVVATRTVSGLTSTEADYAFTLTGGERAAITDQNALRLRITTGTATAVRVTEARVSLTGVAGGGPSEGIVAHGTRSPIRVPRGKPRLRYNGPQRLGQLVSAAEAITATGAVAFGLSVTATGTVAGAVTGTASLAFGLSVSGTGDAGAAPSGLTARGVRRPVRVPRVRARLKYNGPQRLSGLSYLPPVTGTGTLAFGLSITGTGDSGTIPDGLGLITATLTRTRAVRADLTRVPAQNATLSHVHGTATLTRVVASNATLTHRTDD
jgi:hypothetical protein